MNNNPVVQKLLDAQLLVSSQSMYSALKDYVQTTEFTEWNKTHTYGTNLLRYISAVDSSCSDMSDKNLLANVTTILSTISTLMPNIELANMDS